jgi:Holliday junction resolvase RusA-like endonuclease
MSEVVFSCFIPVGRHSSKKNEKKPMMNRGTGRFFVGKAAKAKISEDWLMNKLQIERLKQRVDLIDFDINVKFTFYFPKTVFFTKTGERSKRLPDLSNLYELPADVLQKVRIISNDTLIVSHDGSRREPIEGNQYFLRIELTKA